MTPNNILLYLQINVLLGHHQRSSLLQWMETNTETHNSTVCREGDTLEYSVLNRRFPSNSSPQEIEENQ